MKNIRGLILLFTFFGMQSQGLEIGNNWSFYRVYHDMKLDSTKAIYLDRTFEKLGNALFAAFSPYQNFGFVVLTPQQNIENILEVVRSYKPEFNFLSHESFSHEEHDILLLYFWRRGLFDESKWFTEKLIPIYYGPDRKKWDELFQKVLSILGKK